MYDGEMLSPIFNIFLTKELKKIVAIMYSV